MKLAGIALCCSLAIPTVAYAQSGPTGQPTWEDILKQLVQTVLPTVVGALLHWLGVHLGGKAASSGSGFDQSVG